MKGNETVARYDTSMCPFDDKPDGERDRLGQLAILERPNRADSVGCAGEGKASDDARRADQPDEQRCAPAANPTAFTVIDAQCPLRAANE